MVTFTSKNEYGSFLVVILSGLILSGKGACYMNLKNI